jgi:exosortase/archaeosortase family protein
LTVFLIILPFLVSFNEILTKIIERFSLYMLMQEAIVPVEIKMVKVIVSAFGVGVLAHTKGLTVNGTYMSMTWNCIGWQSLLLLTITLLSALRNRKYTLGSKLEAITIGLLGTFLVNLSRLVFIVLLFAWLRPIFAVVYHDYLAAIVTVIWLFFFWWFCFRFVLVEKGNDTGSLAS